MKVELLQKQNDDLRNLDPLVQAENKNLVKANEELKKVINQLTAEVESLQKRWKQGS